MTSAREIPGGEIGSCCAALYESDIARLLMGESFHPGGGATTIRLGELMGLNPSSKVLDVASGKGASALLLAEKFGCEIVGVDLSAKNAAEARAAARARGLQDKVDFVTGDAAALVFPDGSFSAVLCECAFCLFPDKALAAHEFRRVLRPGGVLGLSDLTRATENLPAELQGLLAWIACIADARPVVDYCNILAAAGFHIAKIEPADTALAEMVKQMRLRLLGAEIMAGLKRLSLPGFDFDAAKSFAGAAQHAIECGQLGYVLISAVAP